MPSLLRRMGRLVLVLCFVCRPAARIGADGSDVFFPEHITVGMLDRGSGEVLFPPTALCGPFDAGYRFVKGMQFSELIVGIDVLWIELQKDSASLCVEEIAAWSEYLQHGGSLLLTVSSSRLIEGNHLLELLGARLRLQADEHWPTAVAYIPAPRWREDLAPVHLTEAATLTGVDASVTVFLETTKDGGTVALGGLETVGRGQLAVCSGLVFPLCQEDSGFDNGPFLQLLLGWLGTRTKMTLTDERGLSSTTVDNPGF